MANYKNTTGKSIKESFEAFDLANPEIYNLFEMKVMMAHKMGKKKVSSKLIINTIRWEVFLDSEDSNCNFKINDSYTSHYARKFATLHPGLANMFNFRNLRSAENEHVLESGMKLKEILPMETAYSTPTPTGTAVWGTRKLS